MIRIMDISDYPAVYELWKSTPNLGLRTLDDSEEGILAFLKRNPATNFVAVWGDEVIGVILCGHDGRRGYIYHTVVREDYRGRGIATELIAHAVDGLRREGITRVCLNVMESNEAGSRFWMNRGWEKKDFLGFYSKSITDQINEPLFRE